MPDTHAVEFDHCRELVMLPGSIFEFTSRFVAADKLPSLLALYALTQALSSIPGNASDDAVKWAKLKWWSEELSKDPDSPALHPILRALWQSGARLQLENAQLQGLVRDAFMQVEDTPVSDQQALFERFSTLGVTAIELELALDTAELDSQSLAYLAAATGVFRLVSSFTPGQRAETERLPLNLMAEHGLAASQFYDGKRPAQLSLALAQLAGIGVGWFSRGMQGLIARSGGGDRINACRHLQLRWAMEKRRLQTIAREPAGFMQKGTVFGPMDAWFAWRFLRGL